MSDHKTLARPYAKALFELARGEDDFQAWSTRLATAAAFVGHPDVQALISDPRLSRDRIKEAVLGLIGDSVDEPGRNIVALLADNRRLPVLPTLAELYEELRAEAETKIQAEVTSAYKLDQASQKALVAALKKRTGREVEASFVTDDTLIGGVVIRAGDMVIDASVRGQLRNLAGALSH